MLRTASLLACCTLLGACADGPSNLDPTREPSAGATQPAAVRSEAGEPGSRHLTYDGETGPEHWAELERDAACGGRSQSPVNLIGVEASATVDGPVLAVQYTGATPIRSVRNNGHSVQYDFGPGDYVTLDGSRYDLLQVHFHEASEHTLNGIRFPLETHLVHRDSSGHLAVLAIFAEEGAASEPFTFLEHFMPVAAGQEIEVARPFDFRLNFPTSPEYFHYRGSLTTPPCTERVDWFVFREPITVSHMQVEALREVMPLDNYRDEQALNGRTVGIGRLR